ncbi:MAG: iron ABC transporter permease [Planctomycetota bacterium]|nr:iron ABC transporter permease [Planctomycetota bacterium]
MPQAPRARDVYRYGLFGLLLAVLLAFLIWPMLLTINGGFREADGSFTFRHVQSVFADPVWMAGLGNSLLIATCTTAVCLAFTLPLALLASRYDFPGKAIVSAVLLVPLILPPFVGAIGMRAILGRFGAINALLGQLGIIDPHRPGIDFLAGEGFGGRFWGVVLIESLHLYPVLYLNIVAAMANIDPALDEAALGLGAGRWRRFTQVMLPLIVPGVFAGATIVFIWSLTELGTPLMFDFYTVTPVQIYYGLNEVADNPRPFALVIVLLVVAVGLYFLGRFAFARRAYEMQSKASIAAVTPRLRGVKGLAVTCLFLGLTSLAVLPHIGVVLSSFSPPGSWYRSALPQAWTIAHYEGALKHPLAMGSIRNSLGYAAAAMSLSVALGMAISYLVVRAKIRGGWILDGLAMLPLAVPGLVLAFGYVAMSLAWPFKGGPLDGWADIVGPTPNPIPILVVAYAVRRLPYVVRSISAGLEQTSGQLEEAALNLGASTAMALRRVVIPLIMANVIAGAILAFSFAMLEVSDSLVLAQKERHYPITKAIFELFNRLGDGPFIASAMGVWAMVLLTTTLAGASLMLGKRMGAIFRA